MVEEENARLCKAIGLTSKLLAIYINDNLQFDGLNLTRNQFIVLKILSRKEGICQNDLAFITERDKTSLTRLINALENKSMVKRTTAQDDRRKKILNITEQGRKSLQKAWPIMKKLEDAISQNITSVEFEGLINVLNKVQANVFSLESETAK